LKFDVDKGADHTKRCLIVIRPDSGLNKELKMVKILYMIDDLKFGGAQRQIVELIKNVNRSWIEPNLLVYHQERIHADEILSKKIQIDCIPKSFKFSLWYLIRLINYIKQNRPDIIHSFTETANFWARVGGKLCGCQIIITSIRSSAIRFPYVEKYISNLSSKIILNSDITRKILTGLGVEPNKMVTIQNGVDTLRFTPASTTDKKRFRIEYGLPVEQKIFSLIGQFRLMKNHNCLIDSLIIMRERGDKLPIVLFIGKDFDKILYQKLVDRVNRDNLSFNVRFIQPDPSIEKIYSLSDCILLPSLWEGCSNVLLESMSSGVPVLCSDIPENSCLVENGKQGILFKNNDERMLATSIRNMLDFSDEAMGKMGQEGRKCVQEQYSVEKMASLTETIYQEELSKRGAMKM